MNAKDAALCLCIWQRELNFTVNTTRPDEGRVERLYAVCGHDDLGRGRGGEPGKGQEVEAGREEGMAGWDAMAFIQAFMFMALFNGTCDVKVSENHTT